MIKPPMLAATIESPDDLDTIQYPVYVSPKLDGLRCPLDENGKPWTRKGEEWANSEVAKLFAKMGKKWANLDGEVGIGDPTKEEFFTDTGWFRQKHPEPQPGIVTFFAFDRVGEGTYDERWWKNKVPEVTEGNLQLKWVPQHLCFNKAEVLFWEEKYVALKYEGIIIRSALKTGKYKHGRATFISGELYKYKRFEEDEMIVTGFIEGETNTNEKERDAFGHAKRSSAKAGKVPNGRVGKIRGRCDRFEEEVILGTFKGLSHEDLRYIWEHQEEFIGRVATFWHQKGTTYVKPRIPSFKGWRDDGA